MDLITTPECYNEYFVRHNFLHGACFAATLSKLLGLVIIAGCTVLKVPQIMKIYQNKSGEGISILSITLELASNTIYMAYCYLKHFPFSHWGEMFFLVAQTTIIGMLVLHYDGSTEKATAFGVAYLTYLAVLMSGLVPVDVLWRIQALNILLLVMSRLTQIHENYKNGHTGQLSAITTYLMFLGSVARVFTSVQETGDLVTILGNSVAALSNGILAGQMWYYWDVTKAHAA